MGQIDCLFKKSRTPALNYVAMVKHFKIKTLSFIRAVKEKVNQGMDG